MDSTLIGALIGAGVTIVLSALSAGVMAGKVLARVKAHGDLLSNGLVADVKANAKAIAELARSQAVVIEHQRGQDERLDVVLAGIADLNRSLASLHCVDPRGKCRPARIIRS